jgi:predicted nucleic-acid-binding Zn-ribbon protein
MNLTKEQMDKFLNMIKTVAPDFSCPICHNTDISVPDMLFDLKESWGTSMPISIGKVFPVIPVTCTKCGYTTLFNPITTNIIELNSNKENKNG